MDREMAFGATRGLPESVSLLNRHTSGQQQQSSQQQLESHLATSKQKMNPFHSWAVCSNLFGF